MAQTITLAPSLRQLFKEIDARWPRRDRSIDGWYRRWVPGARPSDHHPDPYGMVHAIDIDKDGIVPSQVVAATARIAMPSTYVIWNRQIYSAIRDFRPVAYSGPSDHTDHIHVSIGYSRNEEQYVGSWGLAAAGTVAPVGVSGFGPATNWQYSDYIDGTASMWPSLSAGLSYQADYATRLRR